MKKIIFTLSCLTVLSACVSTTTETTQTSTPTIAALNQNWTSSLVENKAALRSCIIANKDIQSIKYLEQTATTTNLIVQTKNGTTLECAVNNKTHQIASIQTIETAPQGVKTFYPVGKRVPDSCKGKESLRDTENRIMGTMCY